MLIIDFSEISYSNILREFQKELANQDKSLLPLIRHKILNSIRSVNTNFRGKYGELIISCDANNYWRKNVFPFYKANRGISKEKSKFDFNLLASMVNQIKGEIKQHFPYRVMEVEGAESDDVIAVLAKLLSTDKRYFGGGGLFTTPEDHMIYSSDNDNLQLSARYSNVHCYSFKTKKVISYPDPTEVEKLLIEKSLHGETGDGIVNVLSTDTSLVKPLKQKPITKKFLETTIPKILAGEIPEEIKDKYLRNRKLIDYVHIPENIEKRIIEVYENYNITGNNKTMTAYFTEHKLRQHLDNILDFTTKHKIPR